MMTSWGCARTVAALMLALGIAGCGGGDGGSAASTTGTAATITAATPPGAPTIGVATTGDGAASIAFSAPASAGSSAVTGYTATCTASGTSKTGTGTASPVAVGGLTNGAAYSCSVTATNAAGTGPASAAVGVTPAAASATSASAVDPKKLPVGDSYVSTTTPAVGSAYVCTSGGGSGASAKGPWFNSDGRTFDSTAKLMVSGAVSWVSSFMASLGGATLSVSGNGLPSHTTGTFPIPSTDAVYAYDRNPNSIATQTIAWGLPGSPAVAATPACLNNGAIGVLVTGARLFSPVDAANRDAVAWEAQDSCQGHPESSGAYHYHSISSCLSQNPATRDTPGQHSPLIGYAADGFGIYGNLGEGGKALTNADLDICHGHSHAVTVNGASIVQYHYHKTLEFPYALGCYRGTPATIH